jgi:hypothetical protein
VTTVTTFLLSEPLAAVERALAEAGVTIHRLSPAAALHSVDFRRGLDHVAHLGNGGYLIFEDDDLSPEVVGLVQAFASLFSAAPPTGG